jgi:hypothetical protein
MANRMWIVMLTEWHRGLSMVAQTESFGPFESQEEASEASLLFRSDGRYCSVHEVKPLPTGDSDEPR